MRPVLKRKIGFLKRVSVWGLEIENQNSVNLELNNLPPIILDLIKLNRNFEVQFEILGTENQ